MPISAFDGSACAVAKLLYEGNNCKFHAVNSLPHMAKVGCFKVLRICLFDGESSSSDGKSSSSDGKSSTSDGKSSTSDGKSSTSDGKSSKAVTEKLKEC